MNWAIWGPVIGSVLTGLITLVGVLSANNAQRKVSETKQDARMDALEAKQDANHRETVAAINDLKEENNQRIGELKVEQQKHNQLMERTYALEKDVAVLKAKK